MLRQSDCLAAATHPTRSTGVRWPQLALDDSKAAVADLEQVVERDPKYDYQRAAGLLAHALGKSGQPERALALFAETLELSTLSETQCNYAALLADQGRKAEAREWADKVLRKKLTMPSYLRRRERPWFRKAAALIKRCDLPLQAALRNPTALEASRSLPRRRR